MIVNITLCVRGNYDRKPFTFKSVTGNIQGDSFEKSVSYDGLGDLLSSLGRDVREVIISEQEKIRANEV